jgi:3-methyladenine DNA glycosylase AlkC
MIPMAELLKNIYNEKFFANFLDSVIEIKPDFDSVSFHNAINNEEWDTKELKQRMRYITLVLNQHLTDNYKENVAFLLNLIPVLRNNGFESDSLEFIFFPDYIEVFGLDDFTTSINAFEIITQFITCEFAVRPFIIKYEEKMIAKMFDWSNHNHAMVRRLATEGCRPRLPWAIALPSFKNNPKPIIAILENLKNDDSESVRRSVANNLNDISKDNPEMVIAIVKKWKGENDNLDALVKHAGRTLLKQGEPSLMKIFGFGSIDNIKIENFKIENPIVSIGDYLTFKFTIINNHKEKCNIRLEYAIYYQKANGSLSKKVYKISEKVYDEHSMTEITRRQPFKIITTRKFHLGKHQVALVVNGVELETHDFLLK